MSALGYANTPSALPLRTYLRRRSHCVLFRNPAHPRLGEYHRRQFGNSGESGGRWLRRFPTEAPPPRGGSREGARVSRPAAPPDRDRVTPSCPCSADVCSFAASQSLGSRLRATAPERQGSASQGREQLDSRTGPRCGETTSGASQAAPPGPLSIEYAIEAVPSDHRGRWSPDAAQSPPGHPAE